MENNLAYFAPNIHSKNALFDCYIVYISVCFSVCITCRWSSTWVERSRTPWLIWVCRTPVMRLSTRWERTKHSPLYPSLRLAFFKSLFFLLAGVGYGGSGRDGRRCRIRERRAGKISRSLFLSLTHTLYK